MQIIAAPPMMPRRVISRGWLGMNPPSLMSHGMITAVAKNRRKNATCIGSSRVPRNFVSTAMTVNRVMDINSHMAPRVLGASVSHHAATRSRRSA